MRIASTAVIPAMMVFERPQLGDVLVSNPSATLEHLIWIVPQQLQQRCPNQTAAMQQARAMAERLQVGLRGGSSADYADYAD